MDNPYLPMKPEFDSGMQAYPWVMLRYLDAWSQQDWNQGVQVETLQILDRVFVRTTNSLYELTIVSPSTGEVLVRGGMYFPRQTNARLAGSSLGRSFLKLKGIYVGFRMELIDQNQTVVTGIVQSISNF